MLRPRRKSRDALVPVSRSIGEPLTLGGLQGNRGAAHIIHAKALTSVLTEIKFGHVAGKVLGFDVLISPNHAALEHAEISLQRVHMNGVAMVRLAGILASGMVHALMTRNREGVLVVLLA